MATSESADNVPYASWRPKRIEAEVFRDTLLWHAGSLELRTGGAPPNVKSGDPSPEDLRRNRETYESSRRRSVYLTIVRTNVYELLTLLDFPDSATPVGRRARTVVPTQALLLMNSLFVMRQAELVAQRIMRDQHDRDSRINLLFERLYSRMATAEEMSSVSELVDGYEEIGADETAVWTAVCQTLLTSHEFFYID
jgi:hypothetical protein